MIKAFIHNNLIRLIAIVVLTIMTPVTVFQLLRIACRDYYSWLRIEWASVQEYMKEPK
jgi:hypothetical protein